MPTAPAQAYVMKAREDQDSPEVISGIFSLYEIEMHALITLGSTHSYICTEHVFDRMPSVENYHMICLLLVPWDIVLDSTECIRTIT